MRTLKNVIYVFQEIYKVSKNFYIIMLFLTALTATVSIIDLLSIKYVIDYAFSPSYDVKKFIFLLIGYSFFVIACTIISNYITDIYIHKFEYKLKTHTLSAIYRKSTKISKIHFNNQSFYDRLHRAFDESESRYFQLYIQVLSLFSNIIIFGTVFTIYNDAVILLAVIFNVIVYITYYFIQNKKQYLFEKKEEKFFRFEGYVERIFTEKEYAQELRVYPTLTQKLLSVYTTITRGFIDSYGRYLKQFLGRGILMNTLSYLIYWLSSLYVSMKFLAVEISVGDFLVLLNVVSAMSQKLISVLQGFPDIYKSSLYIDDIREIMNFDEGAYLVEKVTTPTFFQNLEFKEVGFCYDAQSSFALRDISFCINQQEIIGLVGLNGSGKTTILECMLGLLKPTEGQIFLNGEEYKNYHPENLNDIFSVVFQNYNVYEISVAENILMRQLETKEDEEAVYEALKFVGLYDKVFALEKGIHTVLSTDVDNKDFSGGEKQKIVIARAYAKKTPLLLFDEPTSALDIYATNEFYDVIYRMAKEQGRTIVFTSHKLKQVTRADKIIYIEDGRIKEEGSHEELLRLNGSYATLFHLQEQELWNRG